MNILILSGKFGMGHNSAAKAITEEINKIDENINVKTVDLLAYMYPATHEIIYKGFNRVVDKHYELYNKIYKASEKLEMDMKLSSTSINKKMKFLLEKHKPSLIISTLPLCARTISAYKEMSNMKTPLITCVTDISMHSEWITPNTDIYLVPTKDIKDNLIKNDVREDKIFVVGIPVKQEFKNMKRIDEDRSEKNILIMGGGLGLLPEIDIIMKELENIPDLTTTIITGTNKKAYNDLKGKYKNTEVIGFTNRVSDYMNRADFMISKAGGITLFESIYSETPMFVIKPFLAQEIANAEFIENNVVGKVIWSKDEEFVNTILELISSRIELKILKNNIRVLRENIAEDDVFNVIKNLCREYVA